MPEYGQRHRHHRASQRRFKGEVSKLGSGFRMVFEVLQRKELDPFHENPLGLVARMFVDEEE
jgi:fibrillarin-like pre-rRNA processing protein